MAMPRGLAIALVAAVALSWFVPIEALGSGVTHQLHGKAGVVNEVFSNNALCLQRNCINPVFPGLSDLPKLAQAKWVAAEYIKVKPYLSFCRNLINYDLALPSPSAQVAITTLVRKQEDAAITTFFYHLSGMGLEAWEHREPWRSNTSDCVKSVWRMSCFTYLPRAQAGAKDGELTSYLRPCASCCMNYVRSCGVECCDDSAQCVFDHTAKPLGSNVTVFTQGYTSANGPSALCTGAAEHRSGPLRLLLGALLLLQVGASGAGGMSTPNVRQALKWALPALLLVALATTLQGCTARIPTHQLGNWRQAANYLVSYEFIPAGKPQAAAKMNSCSPGSSASPAEQCAGHGYCVAWNSTMVLGAPVAAGQEPLAFCQCDRMWADPECRTQRKSQLKAWLYALFLGFFGADHFYLGFPLSGTLKCMSLGGFGIWWMYDVIRIGSSPVLTASYRVANDLHHTMFVGSFFLALLCIGFFLSLSSALRQRNLKRRDMMIRYAEEEQRHFEGMKGSSYGAAYGGTPLGATLESTGKFATL